MYHRRVSSGSFDSSARGYQCSSIMAKDIYNFSGKLLTGEIFNFSSLKGKVVLIENVASL